MPEVLTPFQEGPPEIVLSRKKILFKIPQVRWQTDYSRYSQVCLLNYLVFTINGDCQRSLYNLSAILLLVGYRTN